MPTENTETRKRKGSRRTHEIFPVNAEGKPDYRSADSSESWGSNPPPGTITSLTYCIDYKCVERSLVSYLLRNPESSCAFRVQIQVRGASGLFFSVLQVGHVLITLGFTVSLPPLHKCSS
jgi:hypothetical protein